MRIKYENENFTMNRNSVINKYWVDNIIAWFFHKWEDAHTKNSAQMAFNFNTFVKIVMSTSVVIYIFIISKLSN